MPISESGWKAFSAWFRRHVAGAKFCLAQFLAATWRYEATCAKISAAEEDAKNKKFGRFQLHWLVCALARLFSSGIIFRAVSGEFSENKTAAEGGEGGKILSADLILKSLRSFAALTMARHIGPVKFPANYYFGRFWPRVTRAKFFLFPPNIHFLSRKKFSVNSPLILR